VRVVAVRRLILDVCRRDGDAARLFFRSGVDLVIGLELTEIVVIAAVRDVLPWSTWPIVPMLTCGLLRSNLLFAI
jgi:hypothetical protein